MSLGHVILNPQKLVTALDAAPQKHRFDDAGDFIAALMGAGETGSSMAQGLFERVNLAQRVNAVFAPWFAAGGPFAGVSRLGEVGIGDTDQMLLDVLTYLRQTPAGQWRLLLQQKLERCIDLMAPVDLVAVARFVRGELEGMIDILKRPLRNGPRNLEAHRALRAAIALRRILRPAFAALDDAEDALPSINLKAQLRLMVRQVLDRLEGPTLDQLQVAIEMLDRTLGVVLRGSIGFRVTAQIRADGPSPATLDDPPIRFEVQAVPHEKPGAVWVFDLVTNIFASFSLLWELIRTNAWAQRPLDGIMMLLGVIWQVTRTVLRGGFGDKVNVSVPDSGEAEFGFGNWLLTDQGDFVMNMLWRLLGSLHEHHAASNWYLSVFRRWLGYITHVSNWRMPYLFVRSLWYLIAFKREPGSPEIDPNRLLLLALPIGWFVAIIAAACIPWKDFQLEAMSPGLIVGIIIPVVLFWVALFAIPGSVLPDMPTVKLDRLTNLVLGIAAVLGALITCLLMGELELDNPAMATALTVTLIIIMVLCAAFAAFTMGEANWSQDFFYAQAFLAGALMVAVLFFVWYFYFDDGRDKPGTYQGLDASRSPFRLPYPAGDNWLCGQGSHGIFSHVPTKWASATELAWASDNHYSYDFNHEPRVPGLAARDGIVVDFVERHPDDKDEPNYLNVLHTAWSDAVDPGSNLERTLTYGQYYHVSHASLRVEQGDRVVQGDHLVNIDNNGRSAQHHLHFASHAQQGRASGGNAMELNVPVVFNDASTRWFRNYPFLAWIGGKGHIPGKPLSMAFYVSDNTRRRIGIQARTVPFQEARLPGHADPHRHVLLLDAHILGGAIPANITLRTSVSHGHSHEATLTAEQIQSLLERQEVPALVTADVLGHTHAQGGWARDRDETRLPATPRFRIAHPIGAQLIAPQSGPFALAGTRWIVRVDDEISEFHDCLAAPARTLADVAVDTGLKRDDRLEWDTLTARMTHAQGRLGVRGVAAAAAADWRFQRIADNQRARPTAHAVPVLVIETRRGGSGMTLEATAATTLPLEGALPGIARGSGAVPDGTTVTRADLAVLIRNGLTAGRQAPVVTVNATSTATHLGLENSGNPIGFSGGSSRLDHALTLAYTAANRRITSAGTLPLGPGRLGIDGVPVPLFSLPATLRFEPTGDAFAAASLSATPLLLTQRGVEQPVWLRAGETDAAVIARRILQQAEGVRAWAEGAAVIVETIDAGDQVNVSLRKDATGGGTALVIPLVAGTAPDGVSIANCAALALEELGRAIRAAQAAATLPFDPAAVAPQVQVNGDRIQIDVAAGHRIEMTALRLTGATPAFSFEPTPTPPGATLRTAALPATIELSGSGWLDLRVDGGSVVRIPLDVERARLELPPLTRLPGAGEQLVVSVQGGAPVTIAFPGTDRSLADVADRIARALPTCTVRIAYRLAVQDCFWGDVDRRRVPLGATNGLRQMGFLRDPTAFEGDRIGFLTRQNFFRDGIALRFNNDDPLRLIDPVRAPGTPTPGLVMVTDGGAGSPITLTPAANWTIRSQPLEGGNPFLLAPGGAAAPAISTGNFGAAVVWNGTAVRHRLTLENATTRQTATTALSLHARPAIVRGTRPGTALPGADRVMNVTVRPPVGAARVHEVNLTGIVLDDLDAVATAINTQVPEVRAWVVQQDSGLDPPLPPGGAPPPGMPPSPVPVPLLHVETRGTGTGWELEIGPLELAGLIGLPIEHTGPGATAVSARGGGDVVDSAGVTRGEIAAMVTRGVAQFCVAATGAAAGLVSSRFPGIRANRWPYAATETARPAPDQFLALRSTTLGSASSLSILQLGPGAPAFPMDLVRTPACRAAIVLAPIAGAVTLNGDLVIRLDEGAPAGAPVPPIVRTVNFPNGTYTGQQIVDRMRPILAGAGTAALFPDGAIVIETNTYGLLGSVRVPDVGSSRAVADILLGAGQQRFARGWPGWVPPHTVPAETVRNPGYRSRIGPASAGALWEFDAGTGVTVSFTVAAGQTPRQLAEGLNRALIAVGGPPIAVAADVDEVLFIEAQGATLNLKVGPAGAAAGGGATLPILNPDQDRPWLTPEREAEPACNLRRTDEERTVRLTRARATPFDPATLDDWGWVRVPLNSGTNEPIAFRFLPPGRYGIDVRSEGASATGYDAAGDRIAASTSSGAPIIHVVRYGLSLPLPRGSFSPNVWGWHRLPDGSAVEEWAF